MVPSIMSPDTTVKPMPFASSSGTSARRASSPARFDEATASYSGIVGTVRMKCAWWLVTNTTRPPGPMSSVPLVSTFTCASRLSFRA